MVNEPNFIVFDLDVSSTPSVAPTIAALFQSSTVILLW